MGSGAPGQTHAKERQNWGETSPGFHGVLTACLWGIYGLHFLTSVLLFVFKLLQGGVCPEASHLQFTLSPREKSGFSELPLQPGEEHSKEQS